MNFLMRPSHASHVEERSVQGAQHVTQPASTLGVLIAADTFLNYCMDEVKDEVGGENGSVASLSSKGDSPVQDNFSDVIEEEGWIAIPYKELPDNWRDASDIGSFRSLDRPFVFPGEQVHILACLSSSKQEIEIITPFKVAAMMNKNGIGQSTKNLSGEIGDASDSNSGEVELNSVGEDTYQNGENLLKEKLDSSKDISASESLVRLEDHKRQTEIILQKFKSSHFFVQIAESGEPLWSKKGASETSLPFSGMATLKSTATKTRKLTKGMTPLSAVIDRGHFNANVSGGVARNIVDCCSLSNGDVVVLLEVNVAVDCLKDPVLEILQFEKFNNRKNSENQDSLVDSDQDPCGELLKWLLPLDNTLPPPTRTLSPPLSSGTGIGSTSQRSTAASSGSQLFSFGHFRSYSMSSLPQNTDPPPPPVATPSSKPNFELEDWGRLSPQKFVKSKRSGSEELLSFRGVSLEPERFSVCCGLEGIYIPGRRWRRKLEIIQPVEIRSFAADCNTDDLLCVQIKNVSPAHTPDIVVYLDAITVVFEEPSVGGSPHSVPLACIEAGNDHSLPNLALRRGEEHSFILKPATSTWKPLHALGQSSGSSHLSVGNAVAEGNRSTLTSDQYAVMVSCRCNYTESRLFFKQPTKWRPHISRDLMISVASEMSRQPLGLNGRVSELPVQVLTLQASNLTHEDLTLTVLAPASFTSPPSLMTLNSAPSSPMKPLMEFSEVSGRKGGERQASPMRRQSSAPLLLENQKENGDSGGAHPVASNEKAVPVSEVIQSSGLGCTHLWLQSRVPLGCVPCQSTATIKLELLPLTDGIITLDTLQIDVKEKGHTYIPQHSLKINATSSVSTGILSTAMVRSPSFDKNDRKKGTWSPEEDEKYLRAYSLRFGHWNWPELPRFAGLARRGKSCRLRWLNYLPPNVKRGNYSKTEEATIKKLPDELGNKYVRRSQAFWKFRASTDFRTTESIPRKAFGESRCND